MAPKFCSCVTLHLLDHIWKLHSVLDTSVQERHWQTEVSSEGHEDGWGKLDKSPVRRNWGYWASSASGIKSFRRTWEQPGCWSHTKGHNGKMRQGAWVGTWAEVQIWFKKNLYIVGDSEVVEQVSQEVSGVSILGVLQVPKFPFVADVALSRR